MAKTLFMGSDYRTWNIPKKKTFTWILIIELEIFTYIIIVNLFDKTYIKYININNNIKKWTKKIQNYIDYNMSTWVHDNIIHKTQISSNETKQPLK